MARFMQNKQAKPMKNEKVNVKESKGQPGKVSTCFEGSPCAELMQKVMGKHGIGSLCDELMKSVVNGNHKGKERPPKARPKIQRTGGTK